MNSFCVLSRHSPESSSESECETDDDSTCSSSSDSEVFDVIAEIKRKKAHPDRLHDELWYNDPGQVRGFYAFAMRVASPHITFTTQGWEGACWLALKWNLTPRAVSRFSEPFPSAAEFSCRVWAWNSCSWVTLTAPVTLLRAAKPCCSDRGGGRRKAGGGKSLGGGVACC